MKRMRAEEAHKIAQNNSVIVQDYLNKIFEKIERAAKEGSFVLYYTSECPDIMIINPIIEGLHSYGYSAESCSLKDINLTIKW